MDFSGASFMLGIAVGVVICLVCYAIYNDGVKAGKKIMDRPVIDEDNEEEE